MREYWKNIDRRMFDFPAFYDKIADGIQDGMTVAEIGLADGASIIYLAEAILNKGKSVKIIGIDNMGYGHSQQLNTILNHIGNAGLGGLVEIRWIDSLNASCLFPDGSLDFVFLDSSHEYEPTKAEIKCWMPKIKDGGILAGHDYFEIEGVRKAVDEILPAAYLKTEQTDSGLGVWWIEKTHKLLNEDHKFIVNRELRKMITDTHGRIANVDPETREKLFKLSEHLNESLNEFNEPKILI